MKHGPLHSNQHTIHKVKSHFISLKRLEKIDGLKHSSSLSFVCVALHRLRVLFAPHSIARINCLTSKVIPIRLPRFGIGETSICLKKRKIVNCSSSLNFDLSITTITP